MLRWASQLTVPNTILENIAHPISLNLTSASAEGFLSGWNWMSAEQLRPVAQSAHLNSFLAVRLLEPGFSALH
jgi:hypothetical protein